MNFRRWLVNLGAAVVIVGCPAPPPPTPPLVLEQADHLIVEKAARTLWLLQGDRTLRRYRVALGMDPLGPKQMEGDGRTPEGAYTIDWRNPDSHYHLSLHISYPEPSDRARAAATNVSPGGDIMIHGLPNDRTYWGPGHVRTDWTAGCIAVTNEEIEDLWVLVPDGTPIEIRP